MSNEHRPSGNGTDNDAWHDYVWMDNIRKETYSPKEVKVKKITIPGRILMKLFKKLLTLFVVSIVLCACDTSISDINEIVASVTGNGDESDSRPTQPTAPPAITPDAPAVTPTTSVLPDTLIYHGRYNIDRPLWYGSYNLSEYPDTMVISIPGCATKKITHNGKRYEKDGWLLKQSESPGRGLAVHYSATCKSTSNATAY